MSETLLEISQWKMEKKNDQVSSDPLHAKVLVVAEVDWRGRLRMLSWHHFPYSPPALLPGILGNHWAHSDVTPLPIAKLPSSKICTTYSLSHFIILPAPILPPPRALKIIMYIAEHACLFPLPFLSPDAFWLLACSSYVCVLCVTCSDGV